MTEAHAGRVVHLLGVLVAFVLLYFGLLFGCLALAVLAIVSTISEPWIAWLGPTLAMPPLGLAAFLIKGLVHRLGVGEATIEVTQAEQPRLFEFLTDLAARTGAAMPSAVLITHSVNAAMLRARSLLGWLLGGKRRLVIGLGLVNALTVREFEAVLAHEFGHFSQATTQVGQWAHQSVVIMRSLVLERDRFDIWLAHARRRRNLLGGIARLVTIGVRLVRALFVRVLTVVVRSGLALSRELEFDADRRAVETCGSDALVSALWKAQRAALAMDEALAQLHEVAGHGLFARDLFGHQQARLAELDNRIGHSDSPMVAALREPYRAGPELHFPPGATPAEVMWYSHPTYHERERSAKDPYVPPPEPKSASAWTLFDRRKRLRRASTRIAYRERLGWDAAADKTFGVGELEARIADEMAERHQASHTHGFYDNRVVDPGPLELREQDWDREQLRTLVAKFRGAALAEFTERWRALDVALDTGGAKNPAVRGQLQAVREHQIVEAHAGDQAIFRWHWLLATPEQRGELFERHEFLMAVQYGIVTLNRHRGRVAAAVGRSDPGASESGSLDLTSALDHLHRDLYEFVTAAQGRTVPSLQNVAGDRDLASLVHPEPFIDALEDHRKLAGWLEKFMPQVARVHGRLRTLHYKNLGALLRLHERIDPGQGA